MGAGWGGDQKLAWLCGACGGAAPPPPAPESRGRDSERGQALVERGGLLVIIAMIVGALSAVGIPGRVAASVSQSVAAIFGTATANGSTGHGPGAGGPGAGPGAAGGSGGGSAGTNGGAAGVPGGGSGTNGAGPPGSAGGGSGAGSAGGGSAAGAGSTPLAAQVESAAADAQRIVAGGGDGWGIPSTLSRHFADHGGDFGSPSEQAYAREAQDFLQRAVSERLPIRVGSDGTIRLYDPASNTFGSYNPDGTTRTYFKPTRGASYWDDQGGQDPCGRRRARGAREAAAATPAMVAETRVHRPAVRRRPRSPSHRRSPSFRSPRFRSSHEGDRPRRAAPWQRLFPARETVGRSARVITDTSSNGTVQYLIAPSSVLIVHGGRGQRASGAQLSAIGDALAAHADFLSRLPSAGSRQIVSPPGSRVRDLHVYPAAPSLAADLLPGFVRHPGAVERAKLGIDVYLDRNGALTGTRIALSCLVDLSAIATRPNRRPAWIGVGLSSTTRVTAAAGSVARR